jgi:hypothetical protein
MRTVETGAGLSTVVFALLGVSHRSIVPDSELVQRIREYCGQHGISTEQITFDILASQDVIASLEPNTYDLALIDGCHNFPIAFVDFFYAGRALKPGGALVIDDLYIWTCEVIAKFLRESPSWRVAKSTKRVCVAVKEDDSGTLNEWRSQPFVWSRSLARSGYSPRRHAIHMAVKALREWLPA